MRLRKLAVIIALASPAAFAGTPPPAAAPAAALGPGATVVQAANNTLLQLIRQSAPAAQVTTAVHNFLDIDALGKASMAAHWSSLKPTEQQQFLKVLRDLIEANYVARMKGQLNYTTVYKGESKLPNGHIMVNTEVTAPSKGRPLTIKLDYELDAQLKAVDIITDGIGLVASYTGQFNTLMKQGGITNVMTKMQNKLNTMQPATTPPTTTPAASPSTQTMPTTKP